MGDALACVDYLPDILDSLFESERRTRPCAAYVESTQTEVNATMRGILVDWLVEVASEFRLVSDTLHAAVACVDRVLSVRPVPRLHLQLVGVACTLIAAKYEEIYAPSVDEFVFITDNTYTRAAVLAAETDALDALAFDLSAPTAKTFLRRFVKAGAADGGGGERLAPLAAYVCELGLLEYASLHFLPSQLAAGAVLVARVALGALPWPPALARAARCAARDVAAAAALLHGALARAPTSTLPAVRDKYAVPAYHCVAALPAPAPLPDLGRL